MNWYRIAKDFYKYAQIWMVPLNSFSDYLRALYELEYKYSMIQSKSFNGVPERQQNITQNLEQELSNVIAQIKDILLPTFSKWLGSHAITKPTQWAQARVNDIDSLDYYKESDETGQAFEIMVAEFERYTIRRGSGAFHLNQKSTLDRTFSGMLNVAFRDINKYPSLKRFAELAMGDYKNSLYDELSSEGFEEFGERWGKKFRSEDQANNFIDRLTLRQVDPESIIYFEDVNSFAAAINRQGLTSQILQEFYKNQVFPAWYGHWEVMGIKETRKNIENITRKLQGISTGNVKNAIAVISLALNATHQSGDMLDYVENDLMDMNSEETKTLLTELSSGGDVEKWNQELREIGVQI